MALPKLRPQLRGASTVGEGMALVPTAEGLLPTWPLLATAPEQVVTLDLSDWGMGNGFWAGGDCVSRGCGEHLAGKAMVMLG